jgi:hypothetical protein
MQDAMPERKPTQKARGAEIDWLIACVLEAAPDAVLTGANLARETEARRQRNCLLLVDSTDPIALTVYYACLRAGMTGPPLLTPRVVTVLHEPFAPLMEVAATHYRTAEHVEAPLDAGEVRAVVLTLGTLTVVRLGPDTTPRHSSPSYRPVQPDVLLVAAAAWRNDKPEGFLLNAVFKTVVQGQRFLARYEAQLVEIEASTPSQGGIEGQLRRFNPSYGGRDVPVEVQARTYAQIGWLERAGLLPDDRFNGLEFTYGCEMDLETSGEVARALGGQADDLS